MMHAEVRFLLGSKAHVELCKGWNKEALALDIGMRVYEIATTHGVALYTIKVLPS